MSSIMDLPIPVLKTLIKSFYKNSLNFCLLPEDIKLLTWDLQHIFISLTVHSNLIKKYPVSNEFSKLFFKKIINALEPSQDIHDDLYSHLCYVLTNSPIKDDYSHRHYVIFNDLSNLITIKETKNIVVNGTTGMRTWEAGLLLADWALDHQEYFKDKYILELGSGVGFTGITIAKFCGPKFTLLTDYHEDVLNKICDNIYINLPNMKKKSIADRWIFNGNDDRAIGVMKLDWSCLEDLKNDIVPDVIIGADIIYDPSILIDLCNVIKRLFDRNKMLGVYIASTIRNEDTYNCFLTTLSSMGFIYKKLLLPKNFNVEWDSNVQSSILQIKLEVND